MMKPFKLWLRKKLSWGRLCKYIGCNKRLKCSAESKESDKRIVSAYGCTRCQTLTVIWEFIEVPK